MEFLRTNFIYKDKKRNYKRNEEKSKHYQRKITEERWNQKTKEETKETKIKELNEEINLLRRKWSQEDSWSYKNISLQIAFYGTV